MSFFGKKQSIISTVYSTWYFTCLLSVLCTVEEIGKREAGTSRYTATRSIETRANGPSDS